MLPIIERHRKLSGKYLNWPIDGDLPLGAIGKLNNEGKFEILYDMVADIATLEAKPKDIDYYFDTNANNFETQLKGGSALQIKEVGTDTALKLQFKSKIGYVTVAHKATIRAINEAKFTQLAKRMEEKLNSSITKDPDIRSRLRIITKVIFTEKAYYLMTAEKNSSVDFNLSIRALCNSLVNAKVSGDIEYTSANSVKYTGIIENVTLEFGLARLIEHKRVAPGIFTLKTASVTPPLEQDSDSKESFSLYNVVDQEPQELQEPVSTFWIWIGYGFFIVLLAFFVGTMVL